MSEPNNKCVKCNSQFTNHYYPIGGKNYCENCKKEWEAREKRLKKKWKDKTGDFNCIICSGVGYKEQLEIALRECEDWEIKKKKKLSGDLAIINEIIIEAESNKCLNRQLGNLHDTTTFNLIDSGGIIYSANEICQKCGGSVKKNNYGDIKPIEHKSNCSNKGNNQPRERERERERAFWSISRSITLNLSPYPMVN